MGALLWFVVIFCSLVGTYQDGNGLVRSGAHKRENTGKKSDSKADVQAKHECTGLMAMKLAETGSTWFATLLQNTPAYTIKKEIFTSKDNNIPVATRERGMRSYLMCDPKLHAKTPVVGFTINPKNNVGIRWADLVTSTTEMANIYVVRWHRSNIVKTAMSIYRKTETKCNGAHVNNIMAGNNMDDEMVQCLQAPASVDVHKLIGNIAHQARFYKELDNAFIQASSQLNASHSLTMYYEDMQEDEAREMGKLATFLGNPLYYKRPRDGTVKKTSNNLRDVVTNFDDVVKGLQGLNVPTSLKCPLVDMFTAVGFEKYVDCDYPGLGEFLAKKE